MISLDKPLDLNDSDTREFLSGIQGNILKGHGRNNANLIFLQFGTDQKQIRRWIADFATTRITSAQRQSAETTQWKSRNAEYPVVNLLLSFEGYKGLGVPSDKIPVEPRFSYFERGMKNQASAERTFNDPPVTTWEPNFQNPIDALFILASNDLYSLETETDAITKEVMSWATRCWVEKGRRLTYQFPGRKEPVTIEHFGFQDGISDPLPIMQDAEKERQTRGWDKWDPVASLNLVLREEPGGEGHHGSFLVFRKLEQNVRGFHQALTDLAGVLGCDREKAGAMAVGRFRDGSPIVPPQQPEANNFNYKEQDPEGQVCPFHAHIRKTNPRGDSPIGLEGERAFRIARRGITYGDRPDLVPGTNTLPPQAGIGLLFMSFQAGLDQFAIQQEGADSNDFARPGVGVDAVYGNNSTPVPQQWPSGSDKKFTIANFVTLKGGEYFFAPSLAFLRGLAMD